MLVFHMQPSSSAHSFNQNRNGDDLSVTSISTGHDHASCVCTSVIGETSRKKICVSVSAEVRLEMKIDMEIESEI